MINPRQIRAARGLLGWEATELGKLTNLSRETIANIESGRTQAREGSLERIAKAFNDAGVEFLPGSGVRMKDRVVQAYEGEGAQQNLLNDVYDTLKDKGGEVLIAHVDETVAIKDLSQEFLAQHIKRLKSANITERMLVREGDTHIVTATEDYRAIPSEYFITTPMFIYGEKLALMSWSPTSRAVVLHDALFAESARRLFNFVWDKAQPLPSTVKGKKV